MKILSFDDLGKNGILIVDKPENRTSFSLVHVLRKITKIKKIGHAGTLDPFASGVMVLLIGKDFTVMSDIFLNCDKEYLAKVHFGVETDTYDLEGAVVATCDKIPSLDDIEKVIDSFQGDIKQMPPMFSAKKISGKKLYELARKGISVVRNPVDVNCKIDVVSYKYPFLTILVKCSKGTYIRSLAYDIGVKLGVGAHLNKLRRICSGPFHLRDCIDGNILYNLTNDLQI